MNRKALLSLAILVLLIGTTAFYPPTNAYVQSDPYVGRTITGTAYFIGGRRPGRTLPFRLIINRFSSEDEINRLNSALQSGGEEELMRVLSRMDVGRIEVGTGVGVPANAIIRTDDGEGRTQLKVLYERELRFGELRYGARRSDYKFGYAELNVGRGENEGMLIPAARVRLRGSNTWEVEDFGTFPARLMGLRVRGGGRNAGD
jgi:hypothetical protein